MIKKEYHYLLWSEQKVKVIIVIKVYRFYDSYHSLEELEDEL